MPDVYAALRPAATTSAQPLQHTQAGLWWPAADPGRLRAAAQAWRSLASEIVAAESAAAAAARSVGVEHQGWAIETFTRYWNRGWVGGQGGLPNAAQACRDMASGLEQYATHVEAARAQIEELIATAATAVVIGVGLTILTVGISDVAAAGVAAGLVAAAAEVGVTLTSAVAAIGADILVGAALGATIGAVSDIAIQEERRAVFHEIAPFSWSEVLTSAGFGAAGGAAGAGIGVAARESGIAVRLGATKDGERAIAEAGNHVGLTTGESWGNPATLGRHFADHGADFGAPTADEYGALASRFLSRSQVEGLPTKIDQFGTIRVYDPATGEFGSFNPSGTTRTYFIPDPSIHGYPTNWDYWLAQPGAPSWTP
ncbi:MAG: hypothetical protein M3024_02160 [Candidatus Dormibacteraeota bacterium]|nr:hypothetical protein [Candidatus Dormibacteraeota bacterium]